MVAIVAGNGTGLERSSAKLLSEQLLLGSAFLGRGNDAIQVNAATGGLIIQNSDEFLVGRGPDSAFNQTYNSLGTYTELDGSGDPDNWLSSTQRRIVLSGAGNAAGSTATLTDWDGTVVVFTYDTGSGRYKSAQNPYRDDVLTWAGNLFTWTEGKSRLTQTFASAIGGRIVSAADTDGNTVTYTYDAATTAGKLTRVTTANSTGTQFNYTDLTYSGSNLASLVTSYYDTVAGTNKTLTRTRYGYDASDRLSTVTIDRTPGDNSIVDNAKYVTTYGYKDAASKLVTSITQTDGTNLAITYDAANRVSSLVLTAASGVTRTTSFSYDTTNRVTTITDPLSNVYEMTYDTANRLTKVEEPAPAAGGNPSIRTFEYTAAGDVSRILTFDNLTSVGNPSLAKEYAVYRYDAAGNLLEMVDGANKSVFYSYGSSNELLSETRYTGLDANGLADGAAPAGAMVTRYVYDAELHLRFTVTPEGRVTEYGYNAVGQLVAQRTYTGTAYGGGTWTEAALASWVSGTADLTQAERTDYSYDFRGNVSTVTSFTKTSSAGAGLGTADYSRVTYVYDQFGKLLSKLSSGYNTLGGEPTAVAETFVYDGLGRVINATSALGLTTTTTYNDTARTSTITAPNSATHVLTYNIAGELLTDAVSGTGITTASESKAYDALGRLRVATDEAGNKTHYVYDRQSRLAATIGDTGAMVEYKYDGADRVVAQVAYANAVTPTNLATLGNAAINTEVTAVRPTVSASDRWAWTVYNRAGQVIETIDAVGAATAFEYDGAGRVTRVTRYANAIASGTVTGFKTTPPASQVLPTADAANDRVTRSFYDNDGLLAATLDAEKYLSEYLYDEAGRQVEAITYYNKPASTYLTSGTLAQIKSTLATHARDVHEYTLYDGAGQVGATIDGEGNVTRYHYSVRGLVDQVIRGQTVTPNTSYTLATLPAASGQLETTRSYFNAAGLETSRVQTLSSGNLTTSYTYNAKGEVTSVNDNAGHVTNFVYDVLGRQLTEQDDIGTAAGVYATTTFQYDTRGNLVKVVDPLNYASYNYYDEYNRLVLAIDAEGYATRTSYNIFGEVTSVTRYYAKATGTGNVAVVPATPSNNLDETTSFTRDLLGRVTVTTDALNATELSSYNALGDRIQSTNKLGGVTSYSYDRRGRLLAEKLPPAYKIYNNSGADVTPTGGLTKVAYQYDARGRLTQQTEAAGLPEQRITSFIYDRADRLVQKTLPSIKVFNRATWTNTLTTRNELYTYDARGNLVESEDASGARSLYYYDEGNRLIAEISPVGTHKTYVYDGNGNVTIERTYSGITSLPATAGGTPPAPTGTPRAVYYTYDRNDQLISTQINSVVAGEVVGSDYVRGTYNLTTTLQYDAMGRVVKETDARGNSVYHYYDKNGLEVAKLDQEKYLTTWTRDSQGNVTTERRYATQFTGTPVVGTIPDPSTSSGDRVTEFTYDQMGRRRTESRLAVAASTINGTSVTTSSVKATIAYDYDEIGAVQTKAEATGDTTTYQYDDYGRLIRRLDQSHADQNGVTVRLSDELFYDALDNLVYERQSNAVTAGDVRVTRYIYEVGGLLRGVINPNGEERYYYYSIRGEKLSDYTFTQRSDDTTDVTFFTFWTYDAAGRLSTEQTASNDSVNGSLWGLKATTSYNSFGEVVSRSVAPEGGSATIVEQMVYDGAGRVVKSNAGDGVWKFFVHDKNGNVTLTMVSTAAANLSAWSQANAYNSVVPSGTTALSSFVQTNLIASVVAYDDRNMAVQTWEPNRTIANAANTATTTTQTLTTQRWYNAFGEVRQERSARNYDTNYAYNTMGRLIQVQAPTVTVVSESGTSSSLRPTENYAYDKSGRLVGVQNANGFWTTRVLLASSGYGGSEALVTIEYRPDSSIWRTGYDVYDNARKLTDGLGRHTTQEFDAADRLTKITRPTGLVEELRHDALGRVTRRWNSLLTSAVVERTDYDAQGRVTAMRNFAGDLTTYSYAWNGATATAGMGTFGAWTKTTSTIADRVSTTDAVVAATETTDAFGHLLARRDFGGHLYSYNYNAAGQLASQSSNAGQSIAYTWYNTGKMATMADNSTPPGTYTTSNVDGTYTYDADGNRTFEKLQGTTYYYDSYGGYLGTNTVTYQEGKGTYDAMGRLLTFTDAGASGHGSVSITNSYDAAGNVRRTRAVHSTINSDQTLGSQVTEDYWYRYDALNRMVLVKGSLVNGAIVRGSDAARTITYDAAGQRASQSRTVSVPGYYDTYAGYIPGYVYESRENYSYNTEEALTEVRIATGATSGEGTIPPAASGAGTLRARTTYDTMGRITDYREFAADGTTVQYNRYSIGYDLRGNVTGETSSLLRGGDTWLSQVTNSWSGFGTLTSSSSVEYKNGNNGNAPDTLTTYTYAWWDAAQQASVAFKPNVSQSTTHTTSFYYDLHGHLTSAYVADGRPRSITYVNDANGQVLVRQEADNSSGGDPKQVWWYFDGQQVGTTGNNGNDDPDYETALNERVATPGTGAFRLGASVGTSHSDFDQAYNSLSPGEGGGLGAAYTVRAGDTLESIAQAMFGDASLWYMIADANGLTGASQLTPGQSLRIPAGVSNFHNTSDTFRPYDSARHIGDTLPTTPKPPKKPKCGVFGQILLMVISVAVSVIAPLGTGFLATIGNAALGSVASQGIGVATGIQDKFSFKGVAMSAIGAGVGAGLQQLGVFAKLGIGGSTFGARLAQGMLASTVSQGIGVATGLQQKFDWAGVAAGGLGNAAGAALGEALADKGFFGTKFGNDFAAATASTLVNAAARSLIEGTDFGDNILAALPDAVGGVLGRALGRTAIEALGPEVLDGGISMNGDAIDRVVAKLPSSLAQFDVRAGLDLDTRVTLAEISGDISPEAASALRARKAELVQNQANAFVAAHPSASGGYLELTASGYATTYGVLDVRSDELEVLFRAEPAHPDKESARAAIAHNRALIREWSAAADAQLLEDAALWGRINLKVGAFFAGSLGLAATLADTGIARFNGEIGDGEALLAVTGVSRALAGASRAPRLAESAGGRSVSLIERVETPDPLTGAGYGVNNPPVRIDGAWSSADIYNALYGRSPKSLGSPHLHHADQMPGAGIHEVLPGDHLGNAALHPNAWNQGVTRSMRTQDANLHWWYRAREQGADAMFPNHIYD